MPTRNDIFTEITRAKNVAQDDVRRKYIKELSDYTQRDTIVYITAYSTTKMPNIPPTAVSIDVSDIQCFMSAVHGLKNNNLDLIIHSPGGSAEATKQIVNYLRAKFSHIRAIIPQNAMSAATMLACACDEIVMGKHSAIGPIDPQITYPFANTYITVPAQSLLAEFEKAKKEIIDDPRIAVLWVKKLENLPHGILDICENTTDLAIKQVSNWLKTYMFKNDPNKDKISRGIAEWLGNAKNHKTHGVPIFYQDARQKQLKITLLEDNPDLQEKVLSVFHSSIVTIEVTNCIKFVENQNGVGTYIQANYNISQKK